MLAGKTTAAIHILQMWSKLGLRPLLATADGNTAVDNIAVGLLEKGLKVVRVAPTEKVREQLQHATLDSKVKKAKQRAAEKRLDRAEQQAVVSLPAAGQSPVYCLCYRSRELLKSLKRPRASRHLKKI